MWVFCQVLCCRGAPIARVFAYDGSDIPRLEARECACEGRWAYNALRFRSLIAMCGEADISEVCRVRDGPIQETTAFILCSTVLSRTFFHKPIMRCSTVLLYTKDEPTLATIEEEEEREAKSECSKPRLASPRTRGRANRCSILVICWHS